MLSINKESTVYIACPSNHATGGPTLLHQLAYKLLQKGVNAVMFYVNYTEGENPVHEVYRSYNIPFTMQVQDRQCNTIVIPESFTHLHFEFKNIQVVFWWLSVDFYVHQITRWRSLLRYHFRINHPTYFIKRDKKNKIIHWAQSQYAKEYLIKNNRQHVYSLSDYLDKGFIENSDKIDLSKKENIVLYNPKKGFEFTQQLIQASPELVWIPIQHMTPTEVIALLSKSKVYVDFGHHPGKDRFPREAAISKCCVITGKRGSSAFDEDVNIPRQYKIDDNIKNIPLIISTIKRCLDNFEKCLEEFAIYRNLISQEETVFDRQLNQLINNNNA